MTFKNHILKLLTNKTIKKILFIDGEEERAIQAAEKHKKDKYIIPILLLKKANKKISKKIQTIVIEDYINKKDMLIKRYLHLRKGKETLEQAEKVIFNPNYFAMLMLDLKEVDGVIGGLVAPTADILRSAFKIIGSKKTVKTISSVMIMEKEEQWYLFTDISVIPEPTQEQLTEIAVNASDFATAINIESKIAFLSFSTSGSGKHLKTEMVQKATIAFNHKNKLKYEAIGEIQFDAALIPEVRKLKYNKETFSGSATIFVFPSLDAGNIGYKIAQRLGNFGAIGPIITGLNKPVNDLSRGATVNDVYNTALLTSLQVIED